MARYGDAQSSLFLAGNHGRVSAVVCDCQNLYPALVDMPGALDDPHSAPYRSMRRLAHGVSCKVSSRPENGNPVSRAAEGRPDFEKICIRFDDGTY